jgi:two-component system, OmpR family, response regulator QseB
VDVSGRLLLVEDERDLAAMLQRLLAREGYVVDVAPDGQVGLHLGLTRTYDALVLDRGLPAIEGLDLLNRLRRKGVRAPALMLTARAAVADRVEGLDAGAQDYLAKPFDVDELLARIRAMLRRPEELDADGDVLALGDRRLDLAARTVVSSNGEEITLSGRECDLLETLARLPQRVFSRAELLESVFDNAQGETVVDTYVSYLRRKLGADVVRTVRGTGYRLGRG